MERGEVAEAFKAGSIVVANEAEQEGVSFGRGAKQPVSRAAFGLASDGLDDAAVEAFDQPIGLRTVWSGQPVIDLLVGTDQIEGMTPGWTVLRLIPHVDGEAVGELTAVVGEDGVNRVREVLQEALDEAGCRLGMSPEMDFQIDETAGSVRLRHRAATASGTQFADKRFFQGLKADRQPFRGVRAVGDAAAVTPAANRGLAHGQLARRLGNRLSAGVDVSSDFRCG
ncbi:MAG: hypothetical protein P8Y53_19345, partial [Pseudolabrys sp.]